MDYDAYVKQNQVVVQFVKDVMPGTIDKYVGTLDYASARFNTILIKLSQDPLLADQHKKDVEECFNAIQGFYSYTTKYITSPYFIKPVYSLVLYIIGTTRIPKIKKLLQSLNN